MCTLSNDSSGRITSYVAVVTSPSSKIALTGVNKRTHVDLVDYADSGIAKFEWQAKRSSTKKAFIKTLRLLNAFAN